MVARKDNRSWKSRSRRDREAVHERMRFHPSSHLYDFYVFDELMRLPLKFWQKFKVDFGRHPFGAGNNNQCIYRRTDKSTYFVAPKQWPGLKCHMTFATTERLVAATINQALMKLWASQKKRKKPDDFALQKPFLLILDDVPGIHPIRTEVKIDNRARKQDIKSLVSELSKQEPNGLIISDMVPLAHNVTNFQRMKGANQYQGANITIILTLISPEKYARLNILGQFLDLEQVVSIYYFDQISQATGRNTGFRQVAASQATATIVASKKTYNCVLRDSSKVNARVQPYIRQKAA
jgi:hypothetical protein